MNLKGGLLLGVGLLVGGALGALYTKSLPPEEDSPEAKIEQLQFEVAKYERQMAAIGVDLERRKDTSKDRMRSIMEQIKNGEEVSLDDVADSMKPFLRDMRPLMMRMHEVTAQDWADAKVGEFSRKYDLSQAEKDGLKRVLEDQRIRHAERIQDIYEDDSSSFVEIARASDDRYTRLEDLSAELKPYLSATELADYQADIAEKRADYVQEDADRYLNRFDEIVELTPEQHEEAFAIMVRSSPDYRTGMDVEGLDPNAGRMEVRARNEALSGILDQDQRRVWEERRRERRADAAEDLMRLGIALPNDWDLLDQGGL